MVLRQTSDKVWVLEHLQSVTRNLQPDIKAPENRVWQLSGGFAMEITESGFKFRICDDGTIQSALLLSLALKYWTLWGYAAGLYKE